MRSLGRKASLKTDRIAASDVSSAGGSVLPKFLRRPLRSLLRPAGEDVRVPRAVWGVVFLGVFAISGYFGVSNQQVTLPFYSAISTSAGFAVKQLEIDGAIHLETAVLRQELQGELSKPLFDVDVEIIKQKVEANSWVKQAVVSKSYPDTVRINLIEREPFAVWQSQGVYQLIDQNGSVLTDLGSEQILPVFANLPHVVGDGANLRVHDFLEEINAYPMLAARSIAYVRVGDRRWDLKMENGITVKLPEKGAVAALERIQRLHGRYELLERDLTLVDMRLPDRLVIRLDAKMAEARRIEIEEQLKEIKKAELKT